MRRFIYLLTYLLLVPTTRYNSSYLKIRDRIALPFTRDIGSKRRSYTEISLKAVVSQPLCNVSFVAKLANVDGTCTLT